MTGWRLTPEPSAVQVPLHKQRLQSHTVSTAPAPSLLALSEQPVALGPCTFMMTRTSTPCLYNEYHPYSFPVPKEQLEW